ncbi:DUF1444 domain-containing protein [Verminephrobacter aporrectodeae]|uniref:DUF1444 domain-containing protein n=1 Tax=Verminephrobacter aporrectodeae TaxID=1110389 RepID=UPI0022383A84|nr:DUF1444 domain-containing protein [Verminephrobacter aporrectodeae]
MLNALFNRFKKMTETDPLTRMLQREKLIPRIKHVDFLKELKEYGVPERQHPASTPLCGELLVIYAFDLPEQFIMATPDQLAQAGIAVSEMPALALQNLARRMPPTTQHVDQHGCVAIRTGGELEATLLLSDSFWEPMQASLGDAIVAAVPRRDSLLLCDSRDARALGQLDSEAQRIFTGTQDAHALSVQKMLRRNGHWELFGMHSRTAPPEQTMQSELMIFKDASDQYVTMKYDATSDALNGTPEDVVEDMKKSGLALISREKLDPDA